MEDQEKHLPQIQKSENALTQDVPDVIQARPLMQSVYITANPLSMKIGYRHGMVIVDFTEYAPDWISMSPERALEIAEYLRDTAATCRKEQLKQIGSERR